MLEYFSVVVDTCPREPDSFQSFHCTSQQVDVSFLVGRTLKLLGMPLTIYNCLVVTLL